MVFDIYRQTGNLPEKEAQEALDSPPGIDMSSCCSVPVNADGICAKCGKTPRTTYLEVLD